MRIEAVSLLQALVEFKEFGTSSKVEEKLFDGVLLPVVSNEFWTAKQRAAHSLHEISYRACFKPQVPAFFIDRLTDPGEVVFDPFMGRGTTVLEAVLKGREGWGNDINPLAPLMLEPRLAPVTVSEVVSRLNSLDLESPAADEPEELLTFFHPVTLRAICRLREYLLQREREKALDPVDTWIRMVAANRLTGHSPGFFSVYTLPPNQATSVKAQQRINQRRGQVPPLRDVREIILKKSRTLLKDFEPHNTPPCWRLAVGAADHLVDFPEGEVSLVVTSPPFLDVIDYAGDNWLRGWFCGIDTRKVSISILRNVDAWTSFISDVFAQLRRLLKQGGCIAFEVGEVRGGTVKLEDAVVRAALVAKLKPELILINDQEFTKTARVWGVDNNRKGTNSNRIVVIRK